MLTSSKPPRTAAVLLLSLLAAGAVTLVAFVTPVKPAAAETPKSDLSQVKTLYAEKCSACHNLPNPAQKGYSRAEWARTVNTMLTKYHASDEITPRQAAQIVDYLATFAPKQNSGTGKHTSDPWATDTLDVWTASPVSSRVFNFESGTLTGLSPVGSGVSGPAPLCAVRPDSGSRVTRVSGPSFPADRFAVLLDRADKGRNFDIRVRFRIDTGKISPAAGIVFGCTAANQYTVLRCNQNLGDLALIQIAGPVHTTLQQTTIVQPPPPAPAPLAPGWHTLRLLVRGGEARGWIDGQKRISVTLPSETTGSIGLWTQGNTSVSFDDWTVDNYDAAPSVPAPLS